jgi:hypothetical protein
MKRVRRFEEEDLTFLTSHDFVIGVSKVLLEDFVIGGMGIGFDPTASDK